MDQKTSNVEKGFVDEKDSQNDLRTEDIALAIIAQNESSAAISDEEAAKVLRRIDFFMLPLMFFIYMLQYLDKVTYGLGSQFGAITDLQLSVVTNGVSDVTRFKLGSSIFWIGFLAGVYPLTVLAQKMPVSKACGSIVVMWGIVFLCAPACTTYQGIWAQRFMLGFFEAGVTPCFMFLTGNFYKKAEQASRSAFWFSGTGASIILGYPIMLGVVSIDMALAKWKSLYLLWGSFTVVFGVIFFFAVPDSPTSCWFLTERQRYIAVERLRENQADIECPTFKISQVWEALTDPRVLLMFCIPLLNVLPNACVSTFQPIVLAGLGYTPKQVLIMSMPAGATNFITVCGMGYIQQRIRNFRSTAYTITLLPVIVCSALLWKLPASNTSGRLASVIIFPIFTSSFVSALSLTTSNVAGATKRGVANTIFLMGYATGQIVGPLTYPSFEGPLYQTGFKVTLIALIVSMLLVYIYTYLGWRENKRRDALGAVAEVDHAFHDLTDKQNLSFRYEL